MRANKIAVGMSGGVDSSVSALLLQEAGYEVLGITMLLKPAYLLSPQDRTLAAREAEDAALVCKTLGIPHLVPDYSKEFESQVIAPFAQSYFAGETPNPCIRCNQGLKFGKMLDLALAEGCAAVATGHYAQTQTVGGRVLLKRADNPKDQSYFLYSLTQHQLRHCRFPLHRLEKDAARELARLRGLPVANKPDSQEICFIKNGGYIPFIESYCGRQATRGNFVSETGEPLGEHGGIYKYTIGQRKGLGVTFGEPRYVTAIHAAENTVVLGKEGSQYKSQLVAEALNFIPFDTLTQSLRVQAKIRNQAKPAPATITPIAENAVLVEFDAPQRAVTPGQAVVFYDGDIVVGGGVIKIPRKEI